MAENMSDDGKTGIIKLSRNLQLEKPVLTSDGLFTNVITLNNAFLIIDQKNLTELEYDAEDDLYQIVIGGTGGGAGTSGTSGASGTAGATGSSGTSGTSGGTGSSGESGTNGTSGTSGTSGSSGTSGESGTNGTSGTSGTSGSSGSSGTSGATGAGGALGYWGSFWSTESQTAASTTVAYPITLNNTDPDSNGISIVSNSQITHAYSGVYNLQFSIQFINVGNNDVNVNVWFRKNGTDIPESSSQCTITGQHGGGSGQVILALNFMLELLAGDYIQLIWQTEDTDVSLEYLPAGTTPATPTTPSVIFTSQQVMYTQAGTNGTSGTSGGTGSSGASGTNGTSGTSGGTGSSGASGTNGTSGTSGAQGTPGGEGIVSKLFNYYNFA